MDRHWPNPRGFESCQALGSWQQAAQCFINEIMHAMFYTYGIFRGDYLTANGPRFVEDTKKRIPVLSSTDRTLFQSHCESRILYGNRETYSLLAIKITHHGPKTSLCISEYLQETVDQIKHLFSPLRAHNIACQERNESIRDQENAAKNSPN
jgi:hypothetical protein